MTATNNVSLSFLIMVITTRIINVIVCHSRFSFSFAYWNWMPGDTDVYYVFDTYLLYGLVLIRNIT